MGFGVLLLAGCRGSPDKLEEAKVLRRFAAPEADWLLSGLTYSLIHTGEEWSRDVVEELESGFRAVYSSTHGDVGPLARRGGLGTYLASLRRGREHADPVVSGYATMVLCLAGDRGLAPELVRVLQEEARRQAPATPGSETLVVGAPDDDPARPSAVQVAAMGLGFLGAPEHAGALAALLGSPSRRTRAAAATALGFLRASDRAAEVSRLLDDEEIAGAAVFALARMGAREHATRIAALLGSSPSTETMSFAYALARLDAREQIPVIARHLGDVPLGRIAAKALAMLGAREHAEAMARLLASADFLARRDGLIALGILGDRERAPAVAALLKDPEVRVRRAAAVALLLLGAREHRRDVLATLADAAPGLSRYDFDPIVVERIAALDERARRELEEWQRLPPQ